MAVLETYNGYPLWRYIPSLPAAAVFVAVFSILTVAHAWKMVRHSMWFCIPFFVGGFFEIVGYVGRAVAHNATGELIPYVLQSTFLLLAPILFAASLYMTLSRVIRAVDGAHCSIIPPRWLTVIFVAGDCISFIVQASGAGLRIMAGQGKSNINPHLGSYIIVGGLVFQIIVFGIFIFTGVRFKLLFQKDPKAIRTGRTPWKKILYMLFMTSAAVMMRNIFRVVEYAMGSDGYLFTVEWGVYAFDASLMTITMALFWVWYPSQLKPAVGDGGLEMEDSPGRTESWSKHKARGHRER
ncbi:unnamed protein product [Clonostachys rosea]|uniref:RTA1-domain-containing protein n=1 Tax=Bionectria ochroleuca TaxID=29856 RepID=A0ABY6U4H8_BIOOC|nr:unnamed protein product [Clonostachys rosea]